MSGTSFFDREAELQQVCAGVDMPLLNIYGEAGIGKSSLLSEVEARLKMRDGPVLILRADLSSLADCEPANRPQTLLRQLIAPVVEAERLEQISQRDVDEAADELVTVLTRRAAQGEAVVLMYDETEKVQEDAAFWKWLETALIGPLVAEGLARQVLAGRVPAPLKRFENRRVVRLIELEPLSVTADARALAEQIIRETAPPSGSHQMECAVDLVLDLSRGHPALTIELSRHVAAHLTEIQPGQSDAGSAIAGLRRALCQTVVKPFIDRFFFADMDDTWREILWQASLLDWFTTTILQAYLERAAPALVEGRNEYFFIGGINRLRLRNTVVWRTTRGDSVYGVIAGIVRRCYEVLWPEQYAAALNAAAATLRALTEEFQLDPQEGENYLLTAKSYARRAGQAGR